MKLMCQLYLNKKLNSKNTPLLNMKISEAKQTCLLIFFSLNNLIYFLCIGFFICKMKKLL